ncbi:glutathionylspermidine synthase family protein [Teichococcus cervicalis]|nr:glutathionylspermidine synthase family protein [Pseudoroseomonas cervicalis]
MTASDSTAPPFRRLPWSTPPAMRRRLDRLGLLAPAEGGAPYWVGDAAYAVPRATAERLLQTAAALHALCLEAIGALLRDGDPAPFGLVSPGMRQAVLQSWQAQDSPLYGRMDFSFSAAGEPVLLDYEADGPLGLAEASYLQWEWFEAARAASLTARGDDQENLLYEKLLALLPRLGLGPSFAIAHGGGTGGAERTDAEYLASLAGEAGLPARLCEIGAVGWDRAALCFTDDQDQPLTGLLKLYPWLWMEQEPHAEALPQSRTRILPAAWTRLLADKALLARLWRQAPGHPGLLPAWLEEEVPADPGMALVAKPCHGDDGEGVTRPNKPLDYRHGRLLRQGWCPPPRFESGQGPVHAGVSVWLVGGEPAGLSFRESRSWRSDAEARFVPHILRG